MLASSHALSTTLRRSWRQLHQLADSGDPVSQHQELLSILSTTVTALFQRYPDQLSGPQHHLLRHLVILEHEYAALLPATRGECAPWQALQDTLLTAVAAAVSFVAPGPTGPAAARGPVLDSLVA